MFAQVPGVVVSTKLTVAVPQLSVAVKVAAAGISAEQDTVNAAVGNAPTKVGATSSFTVMVCVCTVVLPQSSVAVHVLLIVKLFAQSPGSVSCVKVTTAFPQLSVAVICAAAGTKDAQETVRFSGKASLNTGFTKSVILIICVHVSVFPC